MQGEAREAPSNRLLLGRRGGSVAAAAGAAAAAAARRGLAEARRRVGAVRREHGELLLDLRAAAVRAVGLLAVPDELLEVRLALHADVLVDRHRGSLASVRHTAWSSDRRSSASWSRWSRSRSGTSPDCARPRRTSAPGRG